MKKIIIILISAIVFLSLAIFLINKNNESTHTEETVAGPYQPKLIEFMEGFCKSDNPPNHLSLEGIDLKSGVSCAQKDIDKNGTADYVLFGKLIDNKSCKELGRDIDTREFVVLFMEQENIVRTQTLVVPCYDNIYDYPEDDPSNIGKNLGVLPVLIQWGEGSFNYYYYWDNIHNKIMYIKDKEIPDDV